MTALSEFFPVDLHPATIALQFSSSLLTSKQKAFLHMSFKIFVTGQLVKIGLLKDNSNLQTNVYLKVFVFIWRCIIYVSFFCFCKYITRSKVCKIIKEEIKNVFEGHELLKFCILASWLLINHLVSFRILILFYIGRWEILLPTLN